MRATHLQMCDFTGTGSTQMRLPWWYILGILEEHYDLPCFCYTIRWRSSFVPQVESSFFHESHSQENDMVKARRIGAGFFYRHTPRNQLWCHNDEFKFVKFHFQWTYRLLHEVWMYEPNFYSHMFSVCRSMLRDGRRTSPTRQSLCCNAGPTPCGCMERWVQLWLKLSVGGGLACGFTEG